MDTLEAIRIALASLWANKLRSVLTLLGVVIGISSVIAVITLVNGITGYVQEKVLRLGADVFVLSKMSPVITNVEQVIEQEKRKDISIEDFYALRDGCQRCQYVAASVSTAGKVKYAEQSSNDTFIRGWTSGMVPIYDLELIAGRAITDGDVDRVTDVAVIGYDVYDKLLGGAEPLGKEIRVNGHQYTVIGVGKREGKTMGQSRDNWVIVPITAWQRQFGSRKSISVLGKAYGIGQALDGAMDDARVIMRSRRHDLPGKSDSFALENTAGLMNVFNQLTGTFFAAMIVIAAISLVVGGIVIMNIMLVSVTERTREIGIRKAIGARANDVLRQFLLEAVTLSSVGGVIGVAGGITVAKTVTLLIGMPSAIPLWAVFVALFVSASIGIFFGVYPARRAAKLDPIAALRFEL